jgi:anti-sigma B factor antagonist
MRRPKRNDDAGAFKDVDSGRITVTGENDLPILDKGPDDRLKLRLVKLEAAKQCVLVGLEGSIWPETAEYLDKQIQKLVDAGFVRFVFDCSDLSYVYLGVGVFVSFLKTLRPLGGNIAFISMHRQVYEMFQLLGFAQFLDICGTLEEATMLVQQPLSTNK